MGSQFNIYVQIVCRNVYVQIVHGVHHNHDVLNIKKAYPLTHNKTQDLHKFISDKISELNLNKRNLEQKKKKQIEGLTNQKVKMILKMLFK